MFLKCKIQGPFSLKIDDHRCLQEMDIFFTFSPSLSQFFTIKLSTFNYPRIAVVGFSHTYKSRKLACTYARGPGLFVTDNIIVHKNRSPLEIFRHQHHLDHHKRIKNFQLGLRKPRLDLLLDDWKVHKLDEIFKYVCDF